MVKALALVVMLAGVAAAEPYTQAIDMRIDAGRQTIEGTRLEVAGLNLGYERRICGRLRGLAEYEYLWLGRRDTERDMQDVIDGSGHRGIIGLRATLAAKTVFDGHLRLYVDIEGGVGVIHASEPSVGAFTKPLMFVGLRTGYGLSALTAGSRSSPVFEAVLLARAIRIDDSTGYMFGIGMAWGD